MNKSDQEYLDHMSGVVRQAENLVEQILKLNHKELKNRPPYYLDLLGAAYAMSLQFALSEGYKLEDILQHLSIFNESARLSLDLNKDRTSETAH